jgi:hypothetical protein
MKEDGERGLDSAGSGWLQRPAVANTTMKPWLEKKTVTLVSC